MRKPTRYDYIARRIKLKKLFGTDDIMVPLTRMYVDESLSAQEIHDRLTKLGIKITVRSIQRWLKKHGIIRSAGDAFRLAVKKGRVQWAYKDPSLKVRRRKLKKGLRFEVLSADGFKCVLCGNTATQTILEVDHIVPLAHGGTDARDNLRTICYDCNVGKRVVNGER
jgi:predicted restriction endonuclease